MKKLSIEEKAKAYDERLAKARKEYSIHEANNAIGIMDALERVFPELKDEDERIRGNIIATIHLYYGEPLEDEAKEMIAWLEAQGKPTTIDIDKMVNEYANNNEYGNKEFGKPVNCMIRAYRQGINDILKKQGEQKPADTEKGAKGNEKEIPISAWSEEDEKILNLIIARLHSHKNVEDEEYDKDYHWLKFLKDRVQPQSAWKPSDEQIKSLAWVVEYGNTSQTKTLKELLEQLKAL